MKTNKDMIKIRNKDIQVSFSSFNFLFFTLEIRENHGASNQISFYTSNTQGRRPKAFESPVVDIQTTWSRKGRVDRKTKDT